MTNLALRVPLPDVRIFVARRSLKWRSLAEVLAKVSQTTRARFQLKKQIMVHTAQGRLTGWILSLLPVGLGLGMYLVNPDGMSLLWTRPIGLKNAQRGCGDDRCGLADHSKDRADSRLKDLMGAAITGHSPRCLRSCSAGMGSRILIYQRSIPAETRQSFR